jgi:hypothetical protein
MNDTFADIHNHIFDLMTKKNHHNKNETYPKYTPYHCPYQKHYCSPLLAYHMTYGTYYSYYSTNNS